MDEVDPEEENEEGGRGGGAEATMVSPHAATGHYQSSYGRQQFYNGEGQVSGCMSLERTV